MNSGIVRKIDELGRVVIPKEMRRTLGINTGSSIEMSVGEEGEVVLKKFSDVSNILPIVDKLAQMVYESFGTSIVITDDKEVLSCRGTKKDVLGREILLKDAFSAKFGAISSDKVYQTLNGEKVFNNCYIFPIKNDGFVCGYLCVMSDDIIDIKAIEITSYLTDFLSKIVSE